jgi:hypothetical protein
MLPLGVWTRVGLDVVKNSKGLDYFFSGRKTRIELAMTEVLEKSMTPPVAWQELIRSQTASRLV